MKIEELYKLQCCGQVCSCQLRMECRGWMQISRVQIMSPFLPHYETKTRIVLKIKTVGTLRQLLKLFD